MPVDNRSGAVSPTILGSVSRFRRIVVLCVVLAAIGALIYTVAETTEYSAKAGIAITPPPASVTTPGAATTHITPAAYENSQITLIESAQIAQRAAAMVNASMPNAHLTTTALQHATTVKGPGATSSGATTSFTSVTVTLGGSKLAALAANDVVDAYIDQLHDNIRTQANESVTSLNSAIKSISAQLNSLPSPTKPTTKTKKTKTKTKTKKTHPKSTTTTVVRTTTSRPPRTTTTRPPRTTTTRPPRTTTTKATTTTKTTAATTTTAIVRLPTGAVAGGATGGGATASSTTTTTAVPIPGTSSDMDAPDPSSPRAMTRSAGGRPVTSLGTIELTADHTQTTPTVQLSGGGNSTTTSTSTSTSAPVADHSTSTSASDPSSSTSSASTSGSNASAQTTRTILRATLVNLSRTKAQIQVNEAVDLAYRPTVVAATPPTTSANGDFLRNCVLGMVVGLVIGVVAAFGLASLRRRFERSDEPALIYGVRAIATVPAFELDPWVQMSLPIVSRPSGEAAESYRSMATTLRAMRTNGKGLVIVFTAADLGSGTTTTVANCGLALAEMGERTVVVDADTLGRGLTHGLVEEREKHGLPELPRGFTELLSGKVLADTMEPSIHGRGLMVVPCGRNVDMAVHRWRKEELKSALDQMMERFDMVLIDAPPIGAASFGLDIIATAGTVILVVPHHDRVAQHEELALRLPAARANLLGYVYNGAVPNIRFAPYYPVVPGGGSPRGAGGMVASSAREESGPAPGGVATDVAPAEAEGAGAGGPVTPAETPAETEAEAEVAADAEEAAATPADAEEAAATPADAEEEPAHPDDTGVVPAVTAEHDGTEVVDAVGPDLVDTGVVAAVDPGMADTSVVQAVPPKPGGRRRR
jgi:Mrp family chromosome partitioning ATPase